MSGSKLSGRKALRDVILALVLPMVVQAAAMGVMFVLGLGTNDVVILLSLGISATLGSFFLYRALPRPYGLVSAIVFWPLMYLVLSYASLVVSSATAGV